VVYHWTNGVGWVTPTSYEVMRMKVVNHEPVNHPEGTLTLQGGEEVSLKHKPFLYPKLFISEKA
jgi:putative transposase